MVPIGLRWLLNLPRVPPNDSHHGCSIYVIPAPRSMCRLCVLSDGRKVPYYVVGLDMYLSAYGMSRLCCHNYVSHICFCLEVANIQKSTYGSVGNHNNIFFKMKRKQIALNCFFFIDIIAIIFTLDNNTIGRYSVLYDTIRWCVFVCRKAGRYYMEE